MEPFSIEIPAGEDVVSTLVNLAQSCQAGIVVSSCSGLISDVVLIDPVSRVPTSPVQGVFQITRLFGTYINANDGCVPPQVMDTFGGPSFFSILFHDNHGKEFGGIVKEKVMAAGVVLVKGFLFRKPKFHRMDVINGIGEGIEEDDDSIYDDDEEEEEEDDYCYYNDNDDIINACHVLVALKSVN
ncbi:hypothetical protein TSUD_262050 [Trifolium subterraneum]|nr:hypothetical protein TSUD_262050 [Trifolium subterraneum]